MAKGQGVVKFVSIAKIACSPGEVLRHHASELTQTDDDVHNEDLIEQLSKGDLIRAANGSLIQVTAWRQHNAQATNIVDSCPDSGFLRITESQLILVQRGSRLQEAIARSVKEGDAVHP